MSAFLTRYHYHFTFVTILIFSGITVAYGQNEDSLKIRKLAVNSTSYNSGDNISYWSCHYSTDVSLIDRESITSQICVLLNDTIENLEYRSVCIFYQTKKAKRKGLYLDIKYQVSIRYFLSNGLRFGTSNLKIDTAGKIINPEVIIDASLINISLIDAIALISDEIPLDNIKSMSTRHKDRKTPIVYEFISYPDNKWIKYKRGHYCYEKVCTVDGGTGQISIDKREVFRVDPKYVNVTF